MTNGTNVQYIIYLYTISLITYEICIENFLWNSIFVHISVLL